LTLILSNFRDQIRRDHEHALKTFTQFEKDALYSMKFRDLSDMSLQSQAIQGGGTPNPDQGDAFLAIEVLEKI
jgi:hypothetical protein